LAEILMVILLRRVVTVFLMLTVLTGVVYPLLVTAIAQTAFRDEANGSVVERGGKAIGSELLGQAFSSPKYFWGRPSGTTPQPYNGASSNATNQAPTNPAFLDAVKGRLKALHDADPGNTAAVPVDLVTASGSGLDPHISPAAAEYQIARVARARGLSEADVGALVMAHTQGRTFGILGEPRVSVLALNLALDARGK
jgi:K+-transporting ATPase ATPase C chain